MYKYMDDVEIDISAIKTLKLVHFYHVLKEGKVIAAAMAHYDNDKVMNLCVLDKHYDEFVSSIFMVYENATNKDEIIMDDYSKSILDRAVSADTGYYDEYLKQLKEMEKPSFYHQSFMPYIVVPVIKYVIKELYGITGKKIDWNPIDNSWFGRGTLIATAAEGEATFPFVLTAIGTGKYNVRIGNFFTLRDSLEMRITYDHTGVHIEADSTGAEIEAKIDFEADIVNERFTETSAVSLNGKKVFMNVDELETVDMWGDISRMDGLLELGDNESKLYKLPWGQYIFVNVNKTVEPETDNQYVKIGYVTRNKERNNAFVFSYDEIKNPKAEASYMIFNYAMDVFEEKIFGEVVQVYFDPLGFRSRGFYKANLADRYFTLK